MRHFLVYVLTILISGLSYAQNAGIGVTSPVYRLHVTGDSVSTDGILAAHVSYSRLVDNPAITGTKVSPLVILNHH